MIKLRDIAKKSLTLIGVSLIGDAVYYGLYLLTDSEVRQYLVTYGWPWTAWDMLFDFSVTMVISTVVLAHYWRSMRNLEHERDKLRMSILENQLSPHFVFNSFSVLASLIESDPQKASAFLMDLSSVYRFTLSHIDQQTVNLQDELAFLESFISLAKVRFEDSIRIEISPEIYNLQGSLPPASLQILVANAIKHNEHTPDHPVVIEITADHNRINVRNSLRSIEGVESTSIGQRNIILRYKMLTRKKVRINKGSDYYSVTLPLLPAQ